MTETSINTNEQAGANSTTTTVDNMIISASDVGNKAVKTFNPKDVNVSDKNLQADTSYIAGIGPDVARPWMLVDRAISQVEASFSEWNRLKGNARAALWSALGNIYELAAVIDLTEGAKEALVAAVRKHPDVKESDWSPEGKETADLLLTASLGLKSKETKSQWLKAIRSASTCKVPATEAAFVNWLGQRGGIIAAGNLGRGSPADKPQAAEFKFDEFINTLPQRTQNAVMLKIEIDPATDLDHDMCVLLLHRKFDAEMGWTGEFEVVARVGNPDVVRNVAAKVEAGQAANSLSDELRQAAADALRDMNMITLKKAGMGGLKPNFVIEEMRAFIEGIQTLQSHPALIQKYFSGPTRFDISMDDRPADIRRHKATPKNQRSNGNDLAVMQDNCGQSDPARYIANAIPGSLIAYEDDSEKALKEFVARNAGSYRTRLRLLKPKKPQSPKPRRRGSPEPSLTVAGAGVSSVAKPAELALGTAG